MNPSSGNKIAAALGLGDRSSVLRAAGFGLAYFAFAKLSFNVSGIQDNILNCWLPSGLFLGVLLLTERRHWLGLILAGGLGDLAYNYFGPTPWTINYLLPAHLGNSASAVLGAWLVRRFVAERPTLDSVREFIGLLVFGGLLSLPLSATIGALLVKAGNPQADWSLTWGFWYSSDLLGVLLLTPVLLAWRDGIQRPATWRLTPRLAEAAGLCLGTGATLSLAYYFQWPKLILPLFLAIPYVVWASFRFGLRGASLITLFSLLVAQWFIGRGYGMTGSSALSAAAKNVEMLFYFGGFSLLGLFPAVVLAEQRRTEAALREKDRVYRALVENINQGYYLADRRSRFIYCNPAIYAISGYRPEEMTGLSCYRLVAEEDRARVINTYREWIRDPSVLDVQCEFRSVTKSGRKFWVEQSTHFLRDADGRVVEGCSVLRDIAARQAAEAALRESEERGRLVALATQDCIWDWDFTTERGWWNEAYCRFLGVTPEEVAARSHAIWVAHLHPDDAARVDTSLHAAIAGSGNAWSCDYRIRRADGTHVEVHARAHIIRGADGRPQRMIGAMHDVTERLQTAAKLQSSESRLRAIIDHEPECVKLVDPDGLILEMNPAGLRMIEADSLDQVKNQSVYGLIAAEYQAAFRALHDKILRGDSGMLEFDITGLKGTRRTLETHATPLRDAAGIITAMLGVTRDITARKQAEIALRASELKFRSIIEASPTPYALNDDLQRITYLNAAFVRTFGYDLEDIPTLADWWPKAYPDTGYRQWVAANWQARLDKAKQTGAPFEPLELNIQCKDGTARTALVGAAPLGATFKGLHLVVLHDITDRKRAETSIREQADLLNQTRDAIMVTDLGNRFTFWNEGAERITGWSAAEALGQIAESTINLVTDTRLPAIRETVMTTGAWQGEMSIRRKDGRTALLDLRITLVRDAAGQPKGRLSIATDITEKKQMEEQLLRVQRLESLGMLAAGIAHDLNNILSPVLMAAPLLRTRATHPSDLRVLDLVEKSAERGGALVRQILSFAHGVEGEKIRVQPAHLLHEIGALISDTFPKTIRLESEVAPDLRAVIINPTQLHQILLNLCINARDAMPGGGTLNLRARNASGAEAPAGLPSGDYVVLEVADTGIGMNPEVLAGIWEPFFTTKGGGRGTGLGLATVRGIVNNLQGGITVNSAPGYGSTFHIWLPAAKEVSTNPFKARPNSLFPLPGQGELVVVVDDEAAVCELITQVLTAAGYRILSAKDGGELFALHHTRLQEVSLVLMDIGLPDQDGLSLARILQRARPDQRILFITGYTDSPKEASRALPAGLPLLKKPFTGAELLDAVQRALLAPGISLAGVGPVPGRASSPTRDRGTALPPS